MSHRVSLVKPSPLQIRALQFHEMLDVDVFCDTGNEIKFPIVF